MHRATIRSRISRSLNAHKPSTPVIAAYSASYSKNPRLKHTTLGRPATEQPRRSAINQSGSSIARTAETTARPDDCIRDGLVRWTRSERVTEPACVYIREQPLYWAQLPYERTVLAVRGAQESENNLITSALISRRWRMYYDGGAALAAKAA
ncbi:hypothetical protein LSAT2_008180, partial [Lamellibrachia satsuma]